MNLLAWNTSVMPALVGGVGELAEEAQISVAVIMRAVKRGNEPLMAELKNMKKQVMFKLLYYS